MMITKDRITSAQGRERDAERLILSSKPVLYLPLYKLDGTAQFTSRDAYGHLGTVTGATWGIQGRTFDGVDDQIVVADGADSALDLITAMTYEVWVKPDDGGDDYGRFLVKMNAAETVFKTQLGKEAGDETNVRWEQVDLTSGVLNSGTGKMVTGSWNHVVGTYSSVSSTRIIYVNGVNVASDTPTGTIVSTLGGKVKLGSMQAGTQNILGTIGEARIYSRALTATEIRRNFLATRWRYQ